MLLGLKDIYRTETEVNHICIKCGSLCLEVVPYTLTPQTLLTLSSTQMEYQCCLCSEPKQGYCKWCQAKI